MNFSIIIAVPIAGATTHSSSDNNISIGLTLKSKLKAASLHRISLPQPVVITMSKFSLEATSSKAVAICATCA